MHNKSVNYESFENIKKKNIGREGGDNKKIFFFV